VNLTLACVGVSVDQAATALVAALIAAAGTLAAKHRPAGSRTRAADRRVLELADDDLALGGIQEPADGPYESLGWKPPPKARVRAAARALRGL
jgi:hypothetical protein